MAEYILTVDRLSREVRNERREVVDVLNYRKGDVVSGDWLTEHEVKRLVDAGALAEKGTDEAEEATEGESTPGAPEGQDGTPDGQDEYDEMSYADLQAAAKERDLNAGGSAEDLRVRLREDDASE